jgi:hypothetical protein
MKHGLPGGPTAADRWARRWGWAVIALSVLLVYWPLSTFTYGLVQGDTLDCWMPWRWFIASAIQDGHFPLWNPYQQMGYPIYTDLQGPSWYPVVIALGGTVGLSLWTLQGLFLAYVIVGGIGFMQLVRTLGADARIGLVMGLAYALGGFFTGHQMHFYAVISGAWLPWLLAAQLRLMEQPSWRPAAAAAVFQFLLLTGGNHTFTLIGTWLLLVLIVVHVVRAWSSGDRSLVARIVGYEALFAGLALVMACGTLYAWWEVSPYLSRAAGMDYAESAINPFTAHAAWSWFFPYAVGTDSTWLGTDPTMANGYMGVLVLVLAVLALFRRRTAVENTIGLFGLLCLLASFGAALPVHHWLWSLVPGLDLFRFPSYYLWFTALAALVLAAGTLSQWDALIATKRRVVVAVIGVAGLLVLVFIIRAWAMHYREPPFFQGDYLAERLMGLWRWHRVLLVAPVTLLALIGLGWWALGERRRWWLLLALVLLEMGWATTMAQWNTAIGDYSPAMLQGRIDELPRGPVWPELVPMGENTDGSATLKYIWKNVQNFEGRPSHDGFNSFWLKDANILETQHAGLYAAMKRQPFVYLADSIVPLEQYDPATVNPAKDSALVVLAEGANVPGPMRRERSDTVAVAGFDHDGISVHTSTSGPAFLLLQQAWFPGWSATVDGTPVELVRANIAAFGIALPSGSHTVSFRFEKPAIPWLLGISLITFFVTCFALAFTAPPRPSTWLLIALLALFFLAVRWSLFSHWPKAKRVPAAVQALLGEMDATGKGKAAIVVNTGRYPALDSLFEGREAVQVRAERASRLGTVLRATDRIGNAPLWWMDAGLPVAPAVRAALLDRYRVDTVLTEGEVVVALLVPSEDKVPGTDLYDSSNKDGELLHGDSPWTAAWRMSAAELLAKAPGSIVVDAAFTAAGRPRPTIVIERRRAERITDYEAIPLSDTGAAVHTAYIVRNLRELRHPDEEVGAYLWNQGPDSVLVRDLRVRLIPRDLSKW